MKYSLGDLLRRRASISLDLEAMVDLASGRRLSYAMLNGRIDGSGFSGQLWPPTAWRRA